MECLSYEGGASFDYNTLYEKLIMMEEKSVNPASLFLFLSQKTLKMSSSFSFLPGSEPEKTLKMWGVLLLFYGWSVGSKFTGPPVCL